MALWNINNWEYVERQSVTDPKGRTWWVALMDVLGQKGDPDRPEALLEMQYESGRYFTLIYSERGAMQRERGYRSLPEAKKAFDGLLQAVFRGNLDPAQPVFREDLEDD
jgi:hypothetical protein